MKKIIATATMFAFMGLAAFAQEKAVPVKKDGKTIFTEAKCTMCHSVNALKIESQKKDKAVDLSLVGDKTDAATFAKYFKKEAKINDKNHPFPFKGSPEELTTLTTWLGELKTPKK